MHPAVRSAGNTSRQRNVTASSFGECGPNAPTNSTDRRRSNGLCVGRGSTAWLSTERFWHSGSRKQLPLFLAHSQHGRAAARQAQLVFDQPPAIRLDHWLPHQAPAPGFPEGIKGLRVVDARNAERGQVRPDDGFHVLHVVRAADDHQPDDRAAARGTDGGRRDRRRRPRSREILRAAARVPARWWRKA